MRVGCVAQEGGTRTVGEHPAQEVGVEGQGGPLCHIRIRVFRGFEKVGSHEGGGKLRANADCIGGHSGGHIHGGIFEGGHAGNTNSGGGYGLYRRQAQFTQHHERVARKKQVRAGGAAAQALDIIKVESFPIRQASHGLGSQLGIGVGQGLGLAVHGVVAFHYSVVFQHNSFRTRRHLIHLAQHRFNFVVGNRCVGQKSRQPVNKHTHQSFSFPPWLPPE